VARRFDDSVAVLGLKRGYLRQPHLFQDERQVYGSAGQPGRSGRVQVHAIPAGQAPAAHDVPGSARAGGLRLRSTVREMRDLSQHRTLLQ
jgi:hypothetical protein